MVAKAVLWLSKTTKVPILKLGEKYYNGQFNTLLYKYLFFLKEYGLNDLVQAKGSAYDLNIQVF